MTKILAISGSIRNDSYNAQLAHMMVRHLRERGADAAYLDLANFDMPLFNEDLPAEQQPACALKLANLLANTDAVFIASPEYNGSLTPLLKNTIDWVHHQKLGAFSKATFGIASVSSGALAGIMALSHLRDVLSKVGALIAPTALGGGMAADACADKGELCDQRVAARAQALLHELLTIKR